MKSACLLLLLSLPVAAQNGTEQPLTITISALTPKVKAGSDVWVVVKITNCSNERLDESEIISDMTSLDPNLGFDVHDTSGNLLARKVYEHRGRATGQNVNRTIESGATLTQQQNISRFYDLTQPGSYVVQVSRLQSRGRTSGVVKSNTLTIEVKAPTLKLRELSKSHDRQMLPIFTLTCSSSFCTRTTVTWPSIIGTLLGGRDRGLVFRVAGNDWDHQMQVPGFRVQGPHDIDIHHPEMPMQSS